MLLFTQVYQLHKLINANVIILLLLDTQAYHSYSLTKLQIKLMLLVTQAYDTLVVIHHSYIYWPVHCNERSLGNPQH